MDLVSGARKDLSQSRLAGATQTPAWPRKWHQVRHAHWCPLSHPFCRLCHLPETPHHTSLPTWGQNLNTRSICIVKSMAGVLSDQRGRWKYWCYFFFFFWWVGGTYPSLAPSFCCHRWGALNSHGTGKAAGPGRLGWATGGGGGGVPVRYDSLIPRGKHDSRGPFSSPSKSGSCFKCLSRHPDTSPCGLSMTQILF